LISPGAVNGAALPPVSDIPQDDFRQLDHEASKAGIFFEQRQNTVRTFVVLILLAAKWRFIETFLLIKEFLLATLRIHATHG
jgi:hypothetical protein